MRFGDDTYRVFERLAKETRRRGLEHDTNLIDKFGGGFIVLAHPPEVAKRAADFSRSVAREIPAMVHDERQIHTTIGSANYAAQANFDPDTPACRTTLDRMSEGVAEALKIWAAEGRVCSIKFERYLHTSKAAIAAGYPNRGFLRLAEFVSSSCERHGVEIKPPKMAHITLSRFAGAVPPEKLGGFWRLFETTPPLGMSFPIGLKVGYTLWRPNSSRPNPNEDEIGRFTAWETFEL